MPATAPPPDEFTKIELQALKAELMNWQTLRFTLFGVVVTAVAAFLGWFATAGGKLSFGEAMAPVLLLLFISTATTSHFARLILRISTYLGVFYGSLWEGRLGVFREKAKPWQVNTLIAIGYGGIGLASALLAAKACDLKTAPEVAGFASFLGLCVAISLVDLATVDRHTSNYQQKWAEVKAEASPSLHGLRQRRSGR